MASVVLTPKAAEQLDALSNPIHARLLRLIIRLESWPEVSGAKPLSGNLAGSFRLRTGDYRLQFHVVGDKSIGETVIIDGIGHRDGFYEE
jgi:mRNA-degrading endonuclease RelE of RelBE toxin-antitoxin system